MLNKKQNYYMVKIDIKEMLKMINKKSKPQDYIKNLKDECGFFLATRNNLYSGEKLYFKGNVLVGLETWGSNFYEQ